MKKNNLTSNICTTSQILFENRGDGEQKMLVDREFSLLGADSKKDDLRSKLTVEERR